MSENPNPTPSYPMPDQQEVSSILDRNLDKLFSAANVAAAYGTPVQKGERLVIPAAEVFSVAGFGVGYGGGVQTQEKAAGGGGGGGGGGRTFSRPVAVIEVTPDVVVVRPVVDITKIALAALTTFGFMFAMVARMSRGKITE